MNIGKRIGQGATAEIFELDGNRVLKLFRGGLPDELARREYRNTVAVCACGVPAPQAFDCIEQDGRIGIVYERAQGSSLMKQMVMPGILFPAKAKQDAERLAAWQYSFHQKKPEGLLPFRTLLSRNIQETDRLTEAEKQAVLEVLNGLPDGDCLCHGDFHPDNLLVNHGKPVILDWMTASVGVPEADVARTSLIFTTTIALPASIPEPVQKCARRFMKSVHAVYLKKYRELSGLTQEQIDAWKLPLAAARLIERRPPIEQELLLKEIRSRIGSGN